MKKKLALILVLSLFTVNCLTINASIQKMEEKKGFGYDIEKDKTGQLYLDGLPYYENKENKTQQPKVIHESKATLISRGAWITPNGIYAFGKWNTSWENYDNGITKYNTAYDRDFVNVKNTGLDSFKLTTESKTTTKVTGSLKFDFKSVVEANFSVELGKEWGDKFEQEVKNPVAGRKYILESYCIVEEHEYLYPYKSWNDKITIYYASTHDKYATSHDYDWEVIQ